MSSTVTIRPATLDDAACLARWDLEPHVISATSDDPTAEEAFEDVEWSDELRNQCEAYRYFIAELDGRPIGALQIIDPEREPTHYWGKIEPRLRAIDIWIGAASDLGRGYGEQMMRFAFRHCFASAEVTAIVIDPLNSNQRAHKFYQRLGFVPQGLRAFGDDDCLVHRLTREAWRERFPLDAQGLAE